jgi:hypothetical protein
MLFARVVIGDRTLKTVKGRRPEFHPIQIIAQALKRLDQISHNRICSRFRHCDAFVPYPTLRLLSG